MSELLQTHVGWQLNKRIDSVDQLDLDDSLGGVADGEDQDEADQIW